ncbi:hypothetical protein [Pseudarthrobacter sp. N5]|uniref:hypothetical protein n=1 Tax=Pseudarthrobacter sp. N5 TaxID=3418416 RepID=UPI003CF6330B
MEKNPRHQHRQTGISGSEAAAQQEIHVTYFDSDCGRIRTEIFDDAASAEHFASRTVSNEQEWVTIDFVAPLRDRLAA